LQFLPNTGGSSDLQHIKDDKQKLNMMRVIACDSATDVYLSD